jgi:hypothetical protein
MGYYRKIEGGKCCNWTVVQGSGSKYCRYMRGEREDGRYGGRGEASTMVHKAKASGCGLDK